MIMIVLVVDDNNDASYLPKLMSIGLGTTQANTIFYFSRACDFLQKYWVVDDSKQEYQYQYFWPFF